ncbi:MAG: Nudix family hydrolase [Proteobacteria bacterium]|nr:Nudix family hydrolase [Pseudomonadota bacterium]
MIEVAAGVLGDARGRVLLMQRKPGTHLVGAWEFPGGKLEPGETVEQALARELREELGIEAHAFAPLLSLPWRYPEKTIRLHALHVTEWRGAPQPREGHPLRWLSPGEMVASEMPPADRPVVTALRLPDLYAISPGDLAEREAVFAWLQPFLRDPRAPLLQFRFVEMERADRRAIVHDALIAAPELRSRLLVNADAGLAAEFGIGVHLRASQLREWTSRPLPASQWIGASCHDAGELELAACLGADFATLSPVHATASHPDAATMGWKRFAELAFDARLPVYAQGGVGAGDRDTARAAGAQGVAGIRAFL